MLPADVLKMVNELLEQLHRKDKDHQGGIVFNIYSTSMAINGLRRFSMSLPPRHQQNPCSTKTLRSLPCSVSIIMRSYVRPSRHGDHISSAMTQAWMSLT